MIISDISDIYKYKHASLSKVLCCVLLHFTSIGDFVNVLLMTMSFYLTVRLAADLIILCWVIHPPTFQPPADGARSLVSSPVKGFYRR